MEKKRKYKHWIVVSIVALSLLISPISVFAANEYDYNDINLRVDGNSVGWYVFSSDSLISGTTYLDVGIDSSGRIILTPQGGDTITSSTTVGSIYNITCTQAGSDPYVQTLGTNSYRIRGITTVGLNDIVVHVSSAASQLETPTPSFNNNIFAWNTIANATGYNIQYSSTGTSGWTDVANNYSYNQYSISQTGYYRVRALASLDIYNSDFSIGIYCQYQDGYVGDTGSDSGSGSDDGILVWLISRLNNFISGINQFFSNVVSLVSQVGTVFSSLTAFLPEPYATVLWSLAGLLLVFGLFRLF